MDAIFNRWFLEAITRGAYPPEALAGLAPHHAGGLAGRHGADRPGKLDWLGVNYYTRHIHAADPGAPWPATREVEGHLPKTQMGWEIYPDGLYHFLIRMPHELAATCRSTSPRTAWPGTTGSRTARWTTPSARIIVDGASERGEAGDWTTGPT